MGTGMPMPTFVWQTIPHAQDLQAQIWSDLVNFWPIVVQSKNIMAGGLLSLKKVGFRLEKIGLTICLDAHAQKFENGSKKDCLFHH